MIYKVICHRGLNRTEENTHASIIDATKLKRTEEIIYGVEFDIQITKDDNIVCYHDDTMLRLHDNNRRIYDITNEDIQKYNFPYFEYIISELSTNKNLIINIELKVYEPFEKNKLKTFCKSVMDICTYFNVLPQCIFTSFSSNALLELLSINRFIKIGKISEKVYDINELVQLKTAGVNTFIFHKDTIIDGLNNIITILSDVDLYAYTFFNVDKKDHLHDMDIINQIKRKNIGLITDNYYKLTNFLMTGIYQ